MNSHYHFCTVLEILRMLLIERFPPSFDLYIILFSFRPQRTCPQSSCPQKSHRRLRHRRSWRSRCRSTHLPLLVNCQALAHASVGVEFYCMTKCKKTKFIKLTIKNLMPNIDNMKISTNRFLLFSFIAYRRAVISPTYAADIFA